MAAQAGLLSRGNVFAHPAGARIWLGPKQQLALGHLGGPAFVKVLLGPSSSGKSTILQHFQHEATDAVVLPVSGAPETASAVLAGLLEATGLGPWGLSDVEQRNLLTVFVEQRRAQGKRVLVCIDDISKLSGSAWSEIERLRLVEFAGRPLVDLVVTGAEADAARAPLDRLLHDGDTSAVEAVHFLSAPTYHDIAGYIAWRLAHRDIRSTFTDEACQLIARLSRRRFNIVNRLCQALISEPTSGLPRTIDAQMVTRVATEVVSSSRQRGARGSGDSAESASDAAALAGPKAPDRVIVSMNGKFMRTLTLQGRNLIGRGSGNDLRLRSQLLSRHHAAILRNPQGRYFIADLDSTNGMLVNGEYVRRSFLRDGDVVDLCPFRLELALSELGGEADDADPERSRMTASTGETQPLHIIET